MLNALFCKKFAYHIPLLLISLLHSDLRAQSSGNGLPLPRSLAWYAGIAKARGQTTFTVVSMESHDYTPPLEQTLKNSLVAEGRVIASATSNDGFEIFQWYRIKLLKHGPVPPYKKKTIPSDIPTSLGPQGHDEIILRVLGGTTTVDGVQIAENGPESLTLGSINLLFLAPTNQSFYELAFNPHAIAVDAKGNLTHSADHRSTFDQQMDDFATYTDVNRTASELLSTRSH